MTSIDGGKNKRTWAGILAVALVLAGCGNDAREERRRAAGPNPSPAALMQVADAGAGARSFGRCGACHTIHANGGDRNGPNLHGVMGEAIAQNSQRFGYTAALRSKGGRWTPERMDAWLANPSRFAPGTSMRFPGVPDPLERADIIAYLQTQR